jgi:hypothetical protein
VVIRDIVFEGISGTGSDPNGFVGKFNCSSISPCTNVTVRDVHLRSSNGTVLQHNTSFFCTNVSGPPPPTPDDVQPPTCIPAVPPTLSYFNNNNNKNVSRRVNNIDSHAETLIVKLLPP